MSWNKYPEKKPRRSGKYFVRFLSTVSYTVTVSSNQDFTVTREVKDGHIFEGVCDYEVDEDQDYGGWGCAHIIGSSRTFLRREIRVLHWRLMFKPPGENNVESKD